jgi:hypothetical protein
MYKSYELENIKKLQRREVVELIKEGLYHFAELLTAIGIFALGLAIIAFL